MTGLSESVAEVNNNSHLKETLQRESDKRAEKASKKAGEFLTALPNAEAIFNNPHGVIHYNPLLASYTPSHVEFREDETNTYAFMAKGFSEGASLTQEEIERGRNDVSLRGISMKLSEDGNRVRFFVPTSWGTFSETPTGESVPRETRYVKTMLFADLPLDEEAKKMLGAEKPLEGKNVLVVGGAGSGLQVTPHIEKELTNLGVEPTLIFTPEAENMIRTDKDRGEGKRLFDPQRAAYLEELVEVGRQWIKGLESSNWKTGEHAHIKVAEMLRKNKGAILFAPTTSNTIGFLGSGAVKGPLLLLSATIATGDVPYYIAPASEMSRDHRVQKQLLEVLNNEPWRARFIPDRQGVLAGGRIGQGRLAPADEIVRTIFQWDVFAKLISNPSGGEGKILENQNVADDAILLRARKKEQIIQVVEPGSEEAIPVEANDVFATELKRETPVKE